MAPQARSSEPHSRHSHVDRLVGDQPLDERVGVERVAEQGLAGLLAVALDERPRSPLVAGMDDAAVAGRAAEAERLGLDERDAGAAPGQLAGRGDPGVAATDDDDVRRVGQRPAPPIREVRHRRVPVGSPLVVVVERRGTHRRSVAERRVRHAPWNASQSRVLDPARDRRRGLRAGPDAVASAVRRRRPTAPADVAGAQRHPGPSPSERGPGVDVGRRPDHRRRGDRSPRPSTSTTPSSRSPGMRGSPAGSVFCPLILPASPATEQLPGQSAPGSAIADPGPQTGPEFCEAGPAGDRAPDPARYLCPDPAAAAARPRHHDGPLRRPPGNRLPDRPGRGVPAQLHRRRDPRPRRPQPRSECDRVVAGWTRAPGPSRRPPRS